MTFADIPSGAVVFLDANTLIYHFTNHVHCGTASTDLLDRIDRRDVQGVTAAHLITETAHRLMTIEASHHFGWAFAGIARRLRRHWHQVQHLPMFRRAVDEVHQSRIRVAPIDVGLRQRGNARESAVWPLEQ